jgi:predicted membrane protein
MKVIGIILIVFGAFFFLATLIVTALGYASISFGLGFIVLGAYLIVRENNKQKEKLEKEQWEKEDF